MFAAGDSDTDVEFLRDATACKLAINRNKAELMCRAYDNEDGRWLVNPMFIEPEPKFADGYPCSTKGAIDAEGKEVPSSATTASPRSPTSRTPCSAT